MLKNESNRISNIDFLRGIAAVAVLIWHYQHFYFGSTISNNIGSERHIQPLYSIFHLFYTKGYLAVLFFWILSGFVFFHVYKSKSNISGREFFAHRFARLYPLHFITLCLVAALQLICIKSIGSYQIYPFNDVKHFLLNLFFASHWGLQDGFSFNAPIWSVSVEVVIYILFFIFLKFFKLNFVNCAVWVIASYVTTKISNHDIFQCSALFAIGGLLNIVSLKTKQVKKKQLLLLSATILSISAVIIMIFLTRGFNSDRVVILAIFPSLILFATMMESAGFTLGKVGDWFGNITYSSYLIHVPVQLSAILVMDVFLKSRTIVTTEIFFIVYLISVLFLSVFAYKLIELPAKLRLLKAIGR